MPADLASIELPRFYANETGTGDSSVLRCVISHIPYVVFWKDRECRYLGCNRQFAKLVGLANPADIVGLTDFDLPETPGDLTANRADDTEVMETNSPKLHIMETHVDSDGYKTYLDTSKAPLRNQNGEVVGIIGIFVDVTEKVAISDSLAQSSRLESIGHLAASITREINTPVQFVGDNVRFTAYCFQDLMRFITKAKVLAAAAAQGEACSELATEVLKDFENADIDFIDQELPTTFSQTLDGIDRIHNIVQSMNEYLHSNNEHAETADIT